MDNVHNDLQTKTTKASLVTPDAIDLAITGLNSLASQLKERIGEVPYAVELQIAAVTEYLDMLAQSEINSEKDAYLLGINHGALIAIWAHLKSLGYVAEANVEQVPVVTKKEKREQS